MLDEYHGLQMDNCDEVEDNMYKRETNALRFRVLKDDTSCHHPRGHGSSGVLQMRPYLPPKREAAEGLGDSGPFMDDLGLAILPAGEEGPPAAGLGLRLPPPPPPPRGELRSEQRNGSPPAGRLIWAAARSLRSIIRDGLPSLRNNMCGVIDIAADGADYIFRYINR